MKKLRRCLLLLVSAFFPLLFSAPAFAAPQVSAHPVMLHKANSITTLDVRTDNAKEAHFAVYLMFYFENDEHTREKIKQLIDPTTPPRYPRLIKMKITLTNNDTGEKQSRVADNISQESTDFQDAIIDAPIALFKLKKGRYTIFVENLSAIPQATDLTVKLGFARWGRK